MNILIWDIETAPTNAWIWKAWKENILPAQVIDLGRTICWAAKWVGDDKVHFSSEWDVRHKTMVKRLHKMLSEADATVTYNGNHFDHKVMHWEFAKLGLAPPAPSKSIDMYQVVKTQFSPLYKRMDFVAKELGLEGKLSTGGFELWADVMNKDPDARKLMEEYNIQDIHVLEELYFRLLPWIRNHPSHAHYGENKHACPHCGSDKLQRRGYYFTKVSKFRRYQCQDCGAWSSDRLADKTQEKPEIVTR